jgi:hypothetical protein
MPLYGDHALCAQGDSRVGVHADMVMLPCVAPAVLDLVYVRTRARDRYATLLGDVAAPAGSSPNRVQRTP